MLGKLHFFSFFVQIFRQQSVNVGPAFATPINGLLRRLSTRFHLSNTSFFHSFFHNWCSLLLQLLLQLSLSLLFCRFKQAEQLTVDSHSRTRQSASSASTLTVTLLIVCTNEQWERVSDGGAWLLQSKSSSSAKLESAVEAGR